MTIDDPFAPWRNATEFTLEEAAALIAGVVPGRGFPLPKDRTDKDRDLIAQQAKWLGLLRESHADLGVTRKVVDSGTGRRVRNAGVGGWTRAW
jgi:hypothetical protein